MFVLPVEDEIKLEYINTLLCGCRVVRGQLSVVRSKPVNKLRTRFIGPHTKAQMREHLSTVLADWLYFSYVMKQLRKKLT